MDYEKNIKELNQILEKLSSESLTLKDSIELYEKAETIFKNCSEYLSMQTGKVYKIKQELDKYNEELMD